MFPQIDWLIGSADNPDMSSTSPTRAIDYRTVFPRPDAVSDVAARDSPGSHEVWQGWKRMWSKRQERTYFHPAGKALPLPCVSTALRG